MELYTNDEACILRAVKRFIEEKRAFNLNMTVDDSCNLDFILHTLETPDQEIEDKE